MNYSSQRAQNSSPSALRDNLILVVTFLICMFFLMHTWTITAEAAALDQSNSAEQAAADFKAPSTSAEKKIVSISSNGLTPANLTLHKLDASVFLFNAIKDQPVNLAIKFGKNRVHCHSPSLRLDDDGYLRTVNPVPTSSFVLACFPNSGEYEIKVSAAQSEQTGSAAAKFTGYTGKIIVQ